MFCEETDQYQSSAGTECLQADPKSNSEESANADYKEGETKVFHLCLSQCGDSAVSKSEQEKKG